MIVSAIVAVAKNGVIGNNNAIPWYLSDDLKYFKKVTSGHHVIMGKNSLLSIGRPLPNRTNIVISRDPFFTASGCLVAHSVEEALEIADTNEEPEAFIIGGGQIYAESEQYWDKIYLTEVDLFPEGDVFFPSVDFTLWNLIFEETHLASEKNDADFTFKIYKRISD